MPDTAAATLPGGAGPLISQDAAVLRVPAALLGGFVTGVDLEVDWVLEGQSTVLESAGDRWELRVQRPLTHRFEYALVVHRPGGDESTTDPTNPFTVPGPFGDRSEIRFDDYRPPTWLRAAPLDREIDLSGTAARGEVGGVAAHVRLITPADLSDDAPATLLVAHDGSDMLERGGLAHWAAAQPFPVRLALLDPAPGLRNEWYAAAPDYADHVGAVVLPALRDLVATRATVGLGASLGALSMLTVHRRHPATLDALALQSGSFFTAELDPQESHWEQFTGVCTAVAAMMAALPTEVRTVPVLMTVGAIEENRANNEQMAGALAFQGYPVDARTVPDAHTMIGWRDAWSPALDELIARIARAP